MATKGHLLYYPEGKHDILLGKELNDILKSKVNSVTKITYQDLKDLRDNSKLTPGALYRITDYNCTTTQENTKSAGHQFDIVLLALSGDKLAEEGWAMMHDNVYDVTFSDGVTKKCYLYPIDDVVNVVDVTTLLGVDVGDDEITINEETKTATTIYPSTETSIENLTYNYFQNSNLSAWKVWYCLDNDKSRFAWADDSVNEGTPASIVFQHGSSLLASRDASKDTTDDEVDYYCWIVEGRELLPYYTEAEIPNVGDMVFQSDHGMIQPINKEVEVYNPSIEGTGLPNGRGVIYRLIDEFNNDVAYDFKNIQLKRGDNWIYPLSLQNDTDNSLYDASIIGNTIPDDGGIIIGCHNNIITRGNISTSAKYLPNNCMLSDTTTEAETQYFGMIYNSIIGGSNVTVKADYLQAIGCHYAANQNVILNTSYSIYLNNKKVLTET